ncbi:MAG TPA: hypothetical protein VF559_05045 [Caulobacteraceae bacterium]
MAGPDIDPQTPETDLPSGPDVEIPAGSPSEVEPGPDVGSPSDWRPHDGAASFTPPPD